MTAVSDVDEMVLSISPAVGPTPGVETRDVVLVMGPWLAGSTSLVTLLRQRLPEVTFVEAGELQRGVAPAAVVFVVSAVAPITQSDWVLLDTTAANTDLVIGALAKTDVHPDWPELLDSCRTEVAAHDRRYRTMPWVGVAATPVFGAPRVDELVEVLRRELADTSLQRRNRLRAWQFRLGDEVRHWTDDATGVGREAAMAALREQLKEALRQRRVARSERTLGLRSQISQARLQLTNFARNRCSSVTNELSADAAEVKRRRIPELTDHVHSRMHGVVEEVNTGITTHLSDVATSLGLTPPPHEPPPEITPAAPPPLASRRLESRLAMLLGAGFGLGVALTLSRLFADLAPAYTAAGLVAGAVIGLVATTLLVGVRSLLADRAVLDRWVSYVTGDLLRTLEQLVAARVVRADTAMTLEQTRQLDEESARVAQRVADIDAELREHAAAAARAALARNKELPALQRALDAVGAELDTHRGDARQ